jgi:hypothetical protein
MSSFQTTSTPPQNTTTSSSKRQRGLVNCSCADGLGKCKDIQDSLPLGPLLPIRGKTNVSMVAATMVMPYLVTEEISLARWHYPDCCFDDDGFFKQFCDVNPETATGYGGGGQRFSYANMCNQLVKVGRKIQPLKEGEYISAPTVTIQQIEQKIANQRNTAGLARGGSTTAASSSVKRQEEFDRVQKNKYNLLDENLRAFIINRENIAVEVGKQPLREENNELKRQVEELNAKVDELNSGRIKS